MKIFYCRQQKIGLALLVSATLIFGMCYELTYAQATTVSVGWLFLTKGFRPLTPYTEITLSLPINIVNNLVLDAELGTMHRKARGSGGVALRLPDCF